MRKAAAVAIGVGVFALAVRAGEKPPEDFVKAMKDLARFQQVMTKPDAELDFATTKTYVPIVRDAFGVVEKYWTDRNTEKQFFKEINIAREGTKAASDMGVAANLMSPEGIAASVKDIVGRCQGCHEVHREQAPDGTFLIK